MPRTALVATLLLIGALIGFFRFTESLDLKILDAQFLLLRAKFPESVAKGIVIVGIDEATVAKLPEPITLWHSHIAKFLTGMVRGQAAAVGMDVVLPDRSFEQVAPGYDLALVRGIVEARRAYPLVLGVTIDPTGKPRPVHPPFIAAAGEGATAYVLFRADGDGVVRRFDERLAQDGSEIPTLAGQMARRLGVVPGSGIIDYSRGATFPYVPLSLVLERVDSGNIADLQSTFAGKVVVLGSVLRFTDTHRLPVALAAWEDDAGATPGVLIHAQALRSILGQHLIHDAPAWAVGLAAFAAALLWFGAESLTAALTMLGAAIIALLAASTWSLHHGLFFPVSGVAIAASLGSLGRVGFETALKMRERLRLRRSFSGYVSPQIMEEILQGRLMHGLGGGRVRICVMFSDIRAFTTRSEAMSPEAVIHLLNRYFEEMTAAIHDHGGTIDKFMGDGIMAFFNAPKPLENPCEQALAAARDMLARLAALNRMLAAEGIEPIMIGVGLHVGDAIVGHVGSRTRHEYTAIGDVVNVASRLEGLTKDVGYPLVCTRDVVDAIGDKSGFVLLGPKPVKGHTPVEVFGWPSADRH
jgi:class 3 adenylate cyclase